MADWLLSFSHSGGPSITIAACEQLVASIVGPVTTTIGELVGNPRDFYSRSVSITGRRGELRLALRANQALRDADDPEAFIGTVYVEVSAPYAAKLDTWNTLTSELARSGYVDNTPAHAAPDIIGDAEAAGDTATIARVRAAAGGAS
jgi:hypothetical protein